MRTALLSFVLLAVPVFSAPASFSTGRLLLPVHDQDGALVRRLVAASATGNTAEPTLHEVVLQMFDPAGPAEEPTGRLTLEDATYALAQRVVIGTGVAEFTSARGSVRGKGYRYVLADNRLQLTSELRIDTPKVAFAGSAGQVILRSGAPREELQLESFTATGGVVITAAPGAKLPFDVVHADSVSYLHQQGVATVPPPVRVVKDGNELTLQDALVINVNGAPIDLAPSAAPRAITSTQPASTAAPQASPGAPQ